MPQKSHCVIFFRWFIIEQNKINRPSYVSWKYPQYRAIFIAGTKKLPMPIAMTKFIDTLTSHRRSTVAVAGRKHFL